MSKHGALRLVDRLDSLFWRWSTLEELYDFVYTRADPEDIARLFSGLRESVKTANENDQRRELLNAFMATFIIEDFPQIVTAAVTYGGAWSQLVIDFNLVIFCESTELLDDFI